MFCTNCGKKNEDNAKYCVGCGKELPKPTSSNEKTKEKINIGKEYSKITSFNVFEKVDFLKPILCDREKTIIIGLIGAVIVFICSILNGGLSRYFSIGMLFRNLLRTIVISPVTIGYILLFIFALIGSKKESRTGEKVLRIILIILFGLTILLNDVVSMFRYFTFWGLVRTGLDIAILLYYIFTFFTRNRIINNNVYLILAIIRYFVLSAISIISTFRYGVNIGYIFLTMLGVVGSILTIPYFYNSYYEDPTKINVDAKKIVGSNANVPTGVKIASLLVPLVGLILYATNANQDYEYAKTCGKMAIIGFCIGIAISIIIALIPIAILLMIN